MRILFVDDNPDDILLAGDALRRSGLVFEDRAAATLQQAQEALAGGAWSLIICDYNLGSHTGLDVLGEVRARDPHVPFILLSGTIGEERAAEAIRLGANDYVMKDRMTRLATTVRRELESGEARAEQRRLEGRLRAAEERYRTTFERAPVGIAHSDPSGYLLSVNQRLCDMLGVEAEQLLGHRFIEFAYADDDPIAISAHDDIVSGRRATVQYERRYRRGNGTIAWADITLSAVRTPAGELDYVIGLVEDITARKEAHERLSFQARLLDSVEQAVVAVDLQGRITHWNAFAEKLYGWSAEETLGRCVVDLTPSIVSGHDAEAILERLSRAESWSGEIRLRRRDGSFFPALIIDAPLYDASGQLIGTVGVSHDLTERKRAEEDLRESRLQLAEAQEIARTGSWTYDFTTGERHWSTALTHLLQLPPSPTMEEVTARIHPDDRPQLVAMHSRSHETLESGTTEFRAVTPAGERMMTLRYSFTRDADGRPLKGIGVVQDVTESKQLEEELRRRSLQQSVIASLGQIALSGASVSFLLEQAVELIRTVLPFERLGIMQEPGDESPLMVGDALPDSLPPHGVAVPIRFIDATIWGFLRGEIASSQTLSPYDVEFVRSAAAVIGQTLDRRHSESVLSIRARQQSAIARLGRLVLTSVGNDVFERACELLRYGTGARYAFFAELSGRNELTVRAGSLWADIVAPGTHIDAWGEATAGLMKGEPLVVEDYRSTTGLLRENTVPYGILSGVAMPVASARRTFGVLSVQSRSAHHFRPEDVDFIQAAANMLAEAIEREDALVAIDESRARFERIFSGASEVIFSVDMKGRFLTLNPAFELVTGWTSEEWLGRSFADLIIPDQRDREWGVFRQILETREKASSEMVVQGKEREMLFEVQSFPKLENGVVVEIYGFARDVTEARRTLFERERLTRSLELLLESTIEGIYTVDLEGRCTLVNHAAAEFIGLPAEEILGRRMHEIIHRRADGTVMPIEECAVHAVLDGAEPRAIADAEFWRQHTAVVPVAYSVAPIIDAGRRVGAVVTFMDRSERKKLEAKLEQANRVASLGRLAATVAHEFNNVLMGIAPFVDVLRVNPNAKTMAMAIEHISGSVKRGRRVTEDILRFTQPAEPVRTRIDIAAWLHNFAVEAQSLIDKRQTVVVRTEPLYALADANQLHQIFLNLVLNARDAMPGGEGTITLEVRSDSLQRGLVHLIASDTGRGMSEETLRHAFEPLFTTKKRGTGLGLAVAHQIVQRHGGEIQIESTPGEGTSFHIFLPMAEERAEAEPQPDAASPAGQSLRILIVEDDPAVAIGLGVLLECEGFSVTTRSTAESALAAVAESVPDAVILDVGLPDMDGTTVFAQLERDHPRLPVIFSTGHADRGHLERLLARPAVGFLLKPYERHALLQTLATVLRSGADLAAGHADENRPRNDAGG